MRKAHLFVSCLIALAALPVWGRMPRLTVVIVADGLDTYSIEQMRNEWSDGGLYTLVERGAEGQCVFDMEVYGGHETTATLLTGELPAVHGYCMDEVFDRTDRTAHMSVEDKRAAGIGTMLKVSPRNILSPTLTDMVRLQYGELAQLYAIGQEAASTIIMAGHAANGCCWLDKQRMQWVTSSYYPKGLPAVADEVNAAGCIQQAVNANKSKLLYPYMANEQVVDLALKLQESLHLGEDLVPDMLLMEVTTLPSGAKSDRIVSTEHENMYTRLNTQLGTLIITLQSRLGQANVDFVLVGRPVYGIGASFYKSAGMEVLEFDADRMAALTNAYLMALHGNERWVDGVHGQSVYLNRSLINRKRMSLREMQEEVAQFIVEFEGVQSAFVASDIHNTVMVDRMSKRYLGDVVFCLEAGRQLLEKEGKVWDRVVEPHPSSPVYIYSLHHQQLPKRLKAAELTGIIGNW